ncbi:uncharacterized protein LOC132199852 isoform X2 [Neocloeon triangulifer]|nr:uncharacterized protein LOC132199852 isoform X2 [Neocloeon triangulifer]
MAIKELLTLSERVSTMWHMWQKLFLTVILPLTPISPKVLEKTELLYGALFNKEVRSAAGQLDAFGFIVLILNLYKTKKVNSYKDQQLLLLHLSELSDELNSFLFGSKKMCYRCPTKRDLGKRIAVTTLFCVIAAASFQTTVATNATGATAISCRFSRFFSWPQRAVLTFKVFTNFCLRGVFRQTAHIYPPNFFVSEATSVNYTR